MFADSVACVLQLCAKPKVCPRAPVILLGWAQMQGLVFAHDRICAGGPLVASLEGSVALGHVLTSPCPPPFGTPLPS